MSQQEKTEELLNRHKKALVNYREWDQKVKELLQGRRTKDLNEEDMEAYREASLKRDAAYDQMRHLERVLLDSIPGASTGPFKAIQVDDDENETD